METVIVESNHPYPEATVLHYQTVLSDSVSWMVAEFSPESGIGPDDCLEVYVSEVNDYGMFKLNIYIFNSHCIIYM